MYPGFILTEHSFFCVKVCVHVCIYVIQMNICVHVCRVHQSTSSIIKQRPSTLQFFFSCKIFFLVIYCVCSHVHLRASTYTGTMALVFRGLFEGVDSLLLPCVSRDQIQANGNREKVPSYLTAPTICAEAGAFTETWNLPSRLDDR